MESKKIEILLRVAEVYMRFGIRSVTMDDLCRELGISKKTIYKYFEDKTDLVYQMIELKMEHEKNVCLSCVQRSENAIDELILVSQSVVEHVGAINPSVFKDLKKNYPKANALLENHKWEFILSTVKGNIERGVKENIYRKSIDIDVVSKLYVASTDLIIGGELFQWPEFKFDRLFSEFIRFQIRGLVNDKGLEYLKQRLKNETNN